MTDTTDIAALLNKFGNKLPTPEQARERFTDLLNSPHGTSWFLAPHAIALLDALEAERQRGDEDGRKNVFLYMAMKQRAEKAEARVKELERQKPVVLLPVAEDYPIAWSAASVLADVKAAIESAGGIVKDGE